MRQTFRNLPFKARLALLGGATLMIGTTLAFSRLADTDSAKAPDAARGSVRLVVEDAAVKRDGRFTTSFSPVVKKVSPAVVKVFTTTAPKQNSYQNSNPFFDDPFFRRFFGEESRGQQRQFRVPKQHGLGSG